MTDGMLPHAHHATDDAARLKGELSAVQDFQSVADVFKQLGDASRLRIFWLLCHCEECVVNISALMEMSMPAVSHHLRHLKAGGLIESRRDGKEVYYRAADTERTMLLHDATERVMRIVCPQRGLLIAAASASTADAKDASASHPADTSDGMTGSSDAVSS